MRINNTHNHPPHDPFVAHSFAAMKLRINAAFAYVTNGAPDFDATTEDGTTPLPYEALLDLDAEFARDARTTRFLELRYLGYKG